MYRSGFEFLKSVGTYAIVSTNLEITVLGVTGFNKSILFCMGEIGKMTIYYIYSQIFELLESVGTIDALI